MPAREKKKVVRKAAVKKRAAGVAVKATIPDPAINEVIAVSAKPPLPRWGMVGALVVLLLLVGVEVSMLVRGKIERSKSLLAGERIGNRGSLPNEPGKFWGQLVVRIDNRGRLYIVDHAFNKIVVYQTADGQHLKDIDAALVQKESFSPRNVDVDSQGNIFIMDKTNAELVVVSPEFQLLRRIPVSSPGEMILGPKGEIYVSDAANNEVVHYDLNGQMLNKFGRGKLGKPNQMGADSQGNIYIQDLADLQVKVFTPKGRLKLSFPMKFKNDTDFSVLQVRNNLVFVSQLEQGVIRVYTLDGKLKWEVEQRPCEPFDVDKQGTWYMTAGDGVYKFELNEKE